MLYDTGIFGILALWTMIAMVAVGLLGCFSPNTPLRLAKKLSNTKIMENMAKNYHISPSDTSSNMAKE